MNTVSAILIGAFVTGTLILLIWENHRVGQAAEDADEKAKSAKQRFNVWGSIWGSLLFIIG